MMVSGDRIQNLITTGCGSTMSSTSSGANSTNHGCDFPPAKKAGVTNYN